jgi:DNA-directed RNA polymerase specialized sigma24 family protein
VISTSGAAVKTDRWTNRTDLDPEDIVQETLARVWAERWRLERRALLGYAVVVARNLVTSVEKREDRHRRNEHRLAEPATGAYPAADFLAGEEGSAELRALAALRQQDRQELVAACRTDHPGPRAVHSAREAGVDDDTQLDPGRPG